MTTTTKNKGVGWFGTAVTLADRVKGIETLRAYAPGAAVLDLGCAEGDVANWFMDASAGDAVGIDHNETRIARGRAAFPNLQLFVADLNIVSASPLIDCQFDIVLLLAILQKLNRPIALLDWAIERCERFLAVRTPDPVVAWRWGGAVNLPLYIEASGFVLHSQSTVPSIEPGTTSWVAVFERPQ